MDIFETNDYKVALRKITEELRLRYGQRYTFEKVAHACGIQKTYLSRVLNGKSHLNADQLFSACEFLGLTQQETDFMDALRELQTSCHPKRQAQLKRKIENHRALSLKTESALKINTVKNSEQTWEYYSDFNLHITHLLLTTSQCASSSEKICDILKISKFELEKKIRKLERWGLVVQKAGKFEVKPFNQHLSEDSPTFKSFAISQRLKTIERMNREKSDKDYFFSALISADIAFQTKLRKQILKLLEEARKETEKSKAEQVFQMNIDFFCWN